MKFNLMILTWLRMKTETDMVHNRDLSCSIEITINFGYLVSFLTLN